MRRLLIVRHAQASAGSDDYDRLSPTGHEQAARLGRWLAATGQAPAAIVCGGMRRHAQTAQEVRDAFADAAPTPEIDACLDEYDHTALLSAFLHRYPDHAAAAIARDLRRASARDIAQMLSAVLTAWSDGALDADVRESWTGFRARITEAALRLARRADDGDVLVVTSGGVLAQLAQAALEAAPARVIELNLGIRNSALSEFVADGERLRLLSWNALPHLADAPALWTHF